MENSRPLKKCFENPHFIFFPPFPNLRLGRITFWLQKLKSAFKTHSVSEFYPSQTNILEGGTKDEMRLFEALFNGYWPKLSTHALEKCFENPHFVFCSSFQIFVWGPSEPCGEHKLRNFKARYLTMKQTICEYSNLWKIAHLNSTKSK